ncbi:GlsB/YeaQ/YmgE family stress response membrane protein [Cognatishimia sp. F0-27]|uniref:GlsB/YeaQ/YmgE family stress response membrane protein n=1 Tax=Cognatishimia sp. F0-27 TaxID=2816855 RepID=UPI001D0C6848|nr:GlsB/YeaQ/YmgE family stress response membrane protein [Cognatishimia sp. F0-27]MCC1494524.1 GlsB/YeaQ/YmgE family stress response membrane protein [Cognatishimia sp. F0-27]
MTHTKLSASIAIAATAASPVLAQDQAAEAVGAGIGLVIGLTIAIVVGAVVGWLASLIVKGSGSGLFSDILIGIGGSIVASFLFPALGLTFGGNVIAAILSPLLGAVILLLVIKLIRR